MPSNEPGLLEEAQRMDPSDPLVLSPGPPIHRVLNWDGGVVECALCGRSWEGPDAEAKARSHRC